MTTIEVPWPTAPLSEAGWRTRMTDLAERAESMVGRPCTLQDQAQLAVHWLGLCWSGMSPETIAASCRASLLLGTNVVMATDPASQLAEVAERLDAVWEAAQADPSAALLEVAPPLLDLPPRDRPPEPLPVAEVPEPAPMEPQPMVEATRQSVADAWGLDMQPKPVVEPLDSAAGLTAHEVAELLGTTRSTVGHWRDKGRFGAEGIGWCRVGNRFRYSVAAVEQLEAGNMPKGLDELLSEVRASDHGEESTG